MGSTAMRARGVVDIDTGAILAVTDHAVGRLGPGGRWSDLTPDHVVEAVATGGGTVAMAGEGWLTWWAAGRSVRLEVDRLARIAVRGELVAGMTDAGAALLWPAVDRGVRVDLRVDLHPEGVAVTPDRRVVIWGWTPDGRARLVVLDPDTGAEVEPPASWPSPVTDVSVGLDDGLIAVAQPGGLVVVDPDARVVAAHRVPAIERLAAAGGLLAWYRTAQSGRRLLVGEARLSSGEVHDVVELPAPGSDPLPHLAVGPGGVVLVEGTGPDQLAVHRLVDAGWTEPIRYDLPDGPTGSTTER